MSRRNLTRTIATFYAAMHRILDGIDADMDAYAAADQSAEEAAAPGVLCGRATCARAQRCRGRLCPMRRRRAAASPITPNENAGTLRGRRRSLCV
jgi:hypothetical protein